MLRLAVLLPIVLLAVGCGAQTLDADELAEIAPGRAVEPIEEDE